MKIFGTILILLCAFSLVNAQNVRVNSQLAGGEIEIDEYKTFSWVSSDMEGDRSHMKKDKDDDMSGSTMQQADDMEGDKNMQHADDMEGDKNMQQAGDMKGDRSKMDKDKRDKDQEMSGSATQSDKDMGESTAMNEYGAKSKIDKKKIKEAIKYEMESRGYEFLEEGGELLVDFKVLHGEADVQNFQGSEYGSTWGSNFGGVGATGGGTTGGMADINENTLNLEEGTVVVNMLDKEKGEVVWQAFATDIADEEGELVNTEEEVVASIFEEYLTSADE